MADETVVAVVADETASAVVARVAPLASSEVWET